MIALVVDFLVREGAEEQAKKYIRIMEEQTRHEPGCRLYIGHQSQDDSRRFLFYEQYVDQAALDAHRAAPYFAQYVTNGLATLIESRSASLFHTIS
ncbi:MAG: putative quinol monooxygenase [Terriglobales bacterium]